MITPQRPYARRFFTALLGLALSALLPSCLGNSSKTDDIVTDFHWIEASPMLEDQIDDVIRELPWTRGFERIEQIRWLASVGEPAYPQLLELAVDPRDDVSAAALASLGATLDRRLVDSIKALKWTKERKLSDLGLERARTLVRLGDWESMPELIKGLEDERVYTRSLCIEALVEATRHELEFDPHADPASRELAVLNWQDWWISRTGDKLRLKAKRQPKK